MAILLDALHQKSEVVAALQKCRPGLLDMHLQPLDLEREEVLYESWTRRTWVYFPAGSVVSLVYETEEGRTSELAIVGREGMVGVRQLTGSDGTPMRAVVQHAGRAHRTTGAVIRELFASSPEARELLLRYVQAHSAEIAQTAVCNRHHSIEQQLCRWILTMLDRGSTRQLVMTHEMMSRMLGVRREGVTEVAGKLQQAGAIRYERGHMEVLDRPKLASLACECYGVVRRQLESLLPWMPRRQD